MISAKIYLNFYSKSSLKENHDKKEKHKNLKVEKFVELNEDEQEKNFL